MGIGCPTRVAFRLVPFVLLVISVASGQIPGDRWHVFATEHTTFGTSRLIPESIFFTSPFSGFYATHDSVYCTSDGGITWRPANSFTPIPFVSEPTGVAWARPRWLSVDGGESWAPVQPSILDAASHDSVVDLLALDRQTMVVLYNSTGISGGISVPAGPQRLAYTLDGVTWQRADSLRSIGAIAVVADSTAFGTMPVTGDAALRMPQWVRIIGATSNRVVYVVVTENFGGDGPWHLGRLLLDSGRIEWMRLPPFNAGAAPQMQSGVFEEGEMLYVWGGRQSNRDDAYFFLASRDRGMTWETLALPRWLDVASLRFHTAMRATSANGVSRDGGRSWQPWAHPFIGQRSSNDLLVSWTDTANVFVANRFSLFARSSDAGRSWSTNGAVGLPITATATGARVVAGYEYGAIRTSADSGETWQTAFVPPGASNIEAVISLDRARRPAAFAALARFVPSEAAAYRGLLLSTDDGATWSLAGSLPTLAAGAKLLSDVTGPTPVLYLWGHDGVHASTDGGMSWERRDSLTVDHLRSLGDGALVGLTQSSAARRFLRSSDGARTWQVTRVDSIPGRTAAISLESFGVQSIVAAFPDRFRNGLQWDIATSTDGGATWGVASTLEAERPIGAALSWLSPEVVYSATADGVIERSVDGARTFVRMQGKAPELSGMSALTLTADGHSLFLFSAPGQVGRFRLSGEPSSAISLDELQRERGAISLQPSVMSGGRMRVVADVGSGSEPAVLSIADARGTVLLRAPSSGREHDRHIFDIDLPTTLPVGSYFAVVTGALCTVAPFLVVR